ncbi:hypothetical protein MSIMFI_03134 [Mycobacterium simulans]|nr:hypothetical protein MSIMFI_03134 [Mycobacterium simulans]
MIAGGNGTSAVATGATQPGHKSRFPASAAVPGREVPAAAVTSGAAVAVQEPAVAAIAATPADSSGCVAGSAVTTCSSGAEQPDTAAVPAGPAGCARGAEPAIPTGSAGTDQPGIAAESARSALRKDVVAGIAAVSADTAGTTIAEPPAALAAGAAIAAVPCETVAAPAAGPAVAEQPGGPAVTAGHSGFGAVPAPAAVAPQDAAVFAGLPDSAEGSAVGAVADKRPAQQRLCRRIDRPEQALLDVGLRAGICACSIGEGLHHLLVECRHLGTDGLVALGMRSKERRDGHGHLISGGRLQTDGLGRGERVGLRDCRPDSGQVCGARKDCLRPGKYVRQLSTSKVDGCQTNRMDHRRPCSRFRQTISSQLGNIQGYERFR